MVRQASLPCLPDPPPPGRPDPGAEALRSRSGVEHYELPTRQILNRCTSPRMPFTWTINPYRGCEFGCTYCYARYTHGFFGLERWQDFEQRIFIKRGAAASLERRLRRADFRGQPIAIGTATDPYQPAEHHHRVTRSLLEVFRRAEGLEISVTTKSPLILRDLDLLAELDSRHAVSVHLTITTMDPGLARRIEPHAPDPRSRMRTVAALAAEGISTSVFCMPVLPGLNDRRGVLEPLFRAAVEAGARDLVASPLFLRPAARARFWPWLQGEFPELVSLYRRLYGRRDVLRDKERDRLLATFRRLRLEYDLPRDRPGRG